MSQNNKAKNETSSDELSEEFESFDEVAGKLFRVPVEEVRELERKERKDKE